MLGSSTHSQPLDFLYTSIITFTPYRSPASLPSLLIQASVIDRRSLRKRPSQSDWECTDLTGMYSVLASHMTMFTHLFWLNLLLHD